MGPEMAKPKAAQGFSAHRPHGDHTSLGKHSLLAPAQASRKSELEAMPAEVKATEAQTASRSSLAGKG